MTRCAALSRSRASTCSGSTTSRARTSSTSSGPSARANVRQRANFRAAASFRGAAVLLRHVSTHLRRLHPAPFSASSRPSFPDMTKARVIGITPVLRPGRKAAIMHARPDRRRRLAWALAACLGVSGLAAGLATAPAEQTSGAGGGARLGGPVAPEELPGPADVGATDEEAFLSSMLQTGTAPIELGSALRLAGVYNPQILIARQRVVEAMALRQYAAAQILPSLHAGTSFDD